MNTEFKAPVDYHAKPWGNLNWYGLGRFGMGGNGESFLDVLKEEIPWEQRDAPRKECFISSRTDPYTYGSGVGERTYYPHRYFDVPTVHSILMMVEQNCGGMEACFANYYDGPRDHLGWHADDSPVIDMERPIAVVTFGAEREIWFRDNETKEVEKLTLENGSLLIMKAGMQLTHQHRIPKHGANCGPRLSLTFRGLL